MKIKQSKKYLYKYQFDVSLLLSIVVLSLACFAEYIGIYFLFGILCVALFGIGALIYKIIKKIGLDLFDILGIVFLIIYTIGVIVMSSFDMLLFFFHCTLFVSMMVCMMFCNEEDAKAIALLHVIYMFSCNLVMPCIGTSI